MSPSRRKQVRWLRVALDDLEQIVERIQQEGAPRAAERLAEALFAKTDLLASSPYLGGVSPLHRKVRHLTHGKYVIYYTVHRQEVVVRAVVHGARRFRREWLQRDD